MEREKLKQHMYIYTTRCTTLSPPKKRNHSKAPQHGMPAEKGQRENGTKMEFQQ